MTGRPEPTGAADQEERSSESTTGTSRWPALALVLALVVGGCSTATPDEDDTADGAVASDTESAAHSASADEPDNPTNDQPASPRGLSDTEQADLEHAVDEFLERRGVAQAREVVDLMALSGEPRYGAWLVDLLRMGLSNRLSDLIADSLTEMTGIEPGRTPFEDFGRYGTWVTNQRLDPGPGYREWKLGLYERIDDDFARLLETITDDVDLASIQWGGVPRGGIPELNDPLRISATEAEEWITDDEVVLGVVVNGVAVAYPFRIIGHHELANDDIAGVPVSMVYCTLCRTGLLFDRRVDGQVLDFETSGLLSNSNKIMVDRQTDTLWQHAGGFAIGGPLKGTTLELFPVETTSWVEWVAEHPDTEVVDIPDPIFFDDPLRPPIAYPYEAEGPYRSYYEDPDVWFPILDTPDTFELKAEVIGLDFDGAQLAIGVEDLAGGPARSFDVGSTSVVVAPTSRGARVFRWPTGSDRDSIPESGTPLELASNRSLLAVTADGVELERIAAEQGFWFSWFARHPDTETWSG